MSAKRPAVIVGVMGPSRRPPSDDDSFETFYGSMPSRYQEVFDALPAREHQGIIARRRGAPAYMELWRRVHGASVIVCVVADDRPGLLSLISSALVFHGMDVIAVQAYTRPVVDRPAEAFDLFWLKRMDTLLGLSVPSLLPVMDAPIQESDIVRIEETLRRLVMGTVSVDALISERSGVRRPSSAPTRVTFEDDPGSQAVILTVETPDRAGLLFAITDALFRARVQILGSEVETRDGRALDRFTIVEFDGAPVRMHRRGVVQVEVLSAIEALALGG
jgi:UTP:GlnB (protein PII) uridylyltransferase